LVKDVSCPSEHVIGLEGHLDTKEVNAWQLTSEIIPRNTWEFDMNNYLTVVFVYWTEIDRVKASSRELEMYL
jgi:hypothetical protein